MHFSRISAAAAAFGVATAMPRSTSSHFKRSLTPSFRNGRYFLDNSNSTSFANSATYTFESGSLPDGLKNDIEVVGDRTYTADNVRIEDGYVVLNVPGGQTEKPYTSGSIMTTADNIKYGSVRTVAILPQTAGVCSGMFFYSSDTQEIDIEWLSDPKSESNDGTPQIWFTNQDANGDGEDTHSSQPPPSDAFTTEHEYRIDWTEGNTQWYIDGELVYSTTSDVPSQPGSWMWNNWSDGGKGWSAGPPADDAPLKIKSIEMYYDTA